MQIVTQEVGEPITKAGYSKPNENQHVDNHGIYKYQIHETYSFVYGDDWSILNILYLLYFSVMILLEILIL